MPYPLKIFLMFVGVILGLKVLQALSFDPGMAHGPFLGPAFWQPWGGIALIICAVALLHWVKAKSRQGTVSKKGAQALEQRVEELERRLTDMQDILLSIDERLGQEPRQKEY